MLIELSKPIALVMCLLSLCAVFNAAFLHPASGMEQRMWDCLLLLSLAAGVSLSSGMIFRESIENGIEPVLSTRSGAIVLLGSRNDGAAVYCIVVSGGERHLLPRCSSTVKGMNEQI